MKNITIDALLISAGYSGRMGDFKPLIKINDKPFIIIILEKLISVCNNIVIVTGYRNDDIEVVINDWIVKNPDYEEKVTSVYNEKFHEGMFSSIQKGIEKLTDSDWVLFHFVDQPTIPKEFYNEFISQIDENYDWIQPVYNLTQGHPVIFKKTVFAKVLSSPINYKMKLIREDENVKKKYWVNNYPEILHDIDTKDDYINLVKV